MDTTGVFKIQSTDTQQDTTGWYLHNVSVESVVMALGDKITGDMFYKNNELAVTMKEYVEYNGVLYVIVNPPTIVRDGVVGNNSDSGCMAKYSFEFYHPMYQLSNLPFKDVAVTLDEERYLSENSEFYWIGNLRDFVAKINKNLENTPWIVQINSSVPIDVADKICDEVLSFNNQMVSDALKVGYDTWGFPYIIKPLPMSSPYYSNGKRFAIHFGLPNEEIVSTGGEPYIFRMGRGLGLKNNSRTPRNNKIVTRLAGYGSESNIPYGYPQIVWYGDPSWEYTEYYEDNPVHGHKTTAYPIYDGIVGGKNVRLIKHPFTRKHLMPSVYAQTLFNRVSPYLEDGTKNNDYDPTLELVDYYDAINTDNAENTYPNPINKEAPSYEMHGFEDIKPELESEKIMSVKPIDNNMEEVDEWVDDIDDEGNYTQGYFQLTLPKLDFDLYACAAITQEMSINMRSGACLGCTFQVQVDWDAYKANFYDSDGNFAPNGEQRDLEKFPNSSTGTITIIVQKDTSTFGTLMPNIYQQPMAGDTFVVLGISLPSSYITDAEARLDTEMKSFLRDNNVYYYDYPLKFDEHFLAKNANILAQIEPYKIIRFAYANDIIALYVKQMTIKYGDAALPTYSITLTDDVDVVLNQIGRIAEETSRLGVAIDDVRKDLKDVDISKLSSYLAGSVKYLKQALAQDTDVVGGLVLTTLLALRDANNKIWSGINGAYTDGRGIAAWFGGAMIDHEEEPAKSNFAQSLFRFDGSGYLAGGNISWNTSGNTAINGTFTSNDKNMGNLIQIDAEKGSITMYGPDKIDKTTHKPLPDAKNIPLLSLSFETIETDADTLTRIGSLIVYHYDNNNELQDSIAIDGSGYIDISSADNKTFVSFSKDDVAATLNGVAKRKRWIDLLS